MVKNFLWEKVTGLGLKENLNPFPQFTLLYLCSVCGLKMQRDIFSAYLSRYFDPKTETLPIELARNGW
jgi:hypothetical protein